ncbi:hypothetical protein ARMGADRAFT_1040066 [Armillaria gallica]|uniref:Uncharacterized protein n=1 Tax=Armillaria gallica TaxID=47427 RepID=A0A2H3CPU4_ARMGA|nr:hypothetical protein ARMGADRAFT_1040066 [Armillaria gallica]
MCAWKDSEGDFAKAYEDLDVRQTIVSPLRPSSPPQRNCQDRDREAEKVKVEGCKNSDTASIAIGSVAYSSATTVIALTAEQVKIVPGCNLRQDLDSSNQRICKECGVPK